MADTRPTVDPQERALLMSMERSFSRVVSVQSRLESLREEEERRMQELHREMDRRRLPLWKERSKHIRKVPHFWTHTVSSSDRTVYYGTSLLSLSHLYMYVCVYMCVYESLPTM